MSSAHQISYLWKSPDVPASYRCGVSLHSHTSVSEETLVFIEKLGIALPFGSHVRRHYHRLCRRRYGLTLDFESAHWRPPLQPRMAYELESHQIEKLGLSPMISITDHDSIDAPMLLRAVPASRHIPVSVEWSAPFGGTCFHLGIHNLPSAEGQAWMERFRAFTAAPSDAALRAILRELDSNPQVLIVLNHPLWDLYSIGHGTHLAELRRFLAENGTCMHALELNGLRHAQENREVRHLARDTGHLVISGGDRHSLEPNANINLTDAGSFTDFVHQIRVEGESHVLFMPQYAQPWKQRILHSTLDVVTDFPEFTPGWQRWDERAFHQDKDGSMRPLSELWPKGRPPLMLALSIGIVRMARNHAVARSIGMAFPGVNELWTNYELT